MTPSGSAFHVLNCPHNEMKLKRNGFKTVSKVQNCVESVVSVSFRCAESSAAATGKAADGLKDRTMYDNNNNNNNNNNDWYASPVMSSLDCI